MKKIAGALFIIALVAIFLTIQEEGDKAFGGLMAPIESVRAGNPKNPIAGMTTGNSIPDVAQTNYKKLVDNVRDKVNASMKKSASRYSKH